MHIEAQRREMVHSLSLIRHRVNARRTMNDNDKPRLFALFHRTKIGGFDPLLTTIWTAHTAQPLLPLFHPPIERASNGPRCRLHLDRWVDLTAIGFGVVIDLHI